MQYANVIDELNEGLIAHDFDGLVQLLLVQLVLASAFYLFADVAVIGILGRRLLGGTFG